MKKNVLKTLAIVLVMVLVVATPVFAIGQNFPSADGNKIDKINIGAQKVWGTVTTIVQMLAFAAVVFAGVRYMFASADQKADIKKGLGMLTIGAILVFCASTVVKFITTAAGQVL